MMSMKTIDACTSPSGYWEVTIPSNVADSVEVVLRNLTFLADVAFKNQGKIFCYSSGSLDKKRLEEYHITLTPVDKRIACRESLKKLLSILSYHPMEVFHEFPKPGTSIINIQNIETYDRLVTHESVSGTLFATPQPHE